MQRLSGFKSWTHFLGQVVLQIGPKNPPEGTQEPESRTHIFATGYYGLKTGSLRFKDGF